MNMDDGRYTANIFIDLKKAFDTVDHDILLAKLRKYGVENLEHSWLTSYLSNRKQFCKINGICSKTKDIHCGVPQGSCLGPPLFLIYINDLPFALKKGKVTMYADDTSISYSSSSLVDIEQTLNSELNDLKLWMQGNKLSLNVLKSQTMVVGSKPKIKKITDKIVDHPKFFIGGSQVENVDRVKYLGVIIDKNLNWEEHISNARTKFSRAIGFLKYSRKFLPQNTLSKTYSGIVEPHFRFCCSVWGCCGVTKLQTLQKLQNRAARIVTKSNFDTPSIGLIQSLKWPTVSDIIRGETVTTVYKSLNGLVPEYLSSLFEKGRLEMSGNSETPKLIFRYLYEKLTMGRGLYLFVDLSFGIALNLMLNRHHLLPPLREESNRKLVTFVPRPPEKQFSWTDGATVPK